MSSAERSRVADAADPPPAVLEEIARAIAGIRYGSVEVVIHDARVVQIERRERLRLQGAEGGAGAAGGAGGSGGAARRWSG